MTLFLTVLHVIVCLLLVVIVLLQRGKGAEIGAVFGGGASSTVFGSRGAGNFLTKMTTGAALIFMLTSLSLAYFSQTGSESTLFEGEEIVIEEAVPAEGEPPAPAEPAFEEIVPAAPAEEPAVPDVPSPTP